MSAIKSIRLSELTAIINATIQYAFEGSIFWVVADVTSHSYKAQDDRHFFVLAEKGEGTNSLTAKIDAVAWKPAAAKIRNFETVTGQKFQSGIHVLVAVSVTYNGAYGLKLNMHDIDINFTIGALENEKQKILQRLENECADFIQKDGDRYITRNNQLQLNLVIQKIAIVASSGTAGHEDFMHTLQDNPYGYSFFADNYFTPVQGENNSHLIKQMLIDIFKSGKPYDAVVIIRGGGAQTDFLIFETFELGQVVAKFPIPIITGIGHQRNETIVDIMAHSPTFTPTKAAEFIIAHNRYFEEGVADLHNTIIYRAQQQFQSRRQQLEPVIQTIKNYSRLLLQKQKGQIAHFESVFAIMSPDNILKMGFAVLKHKGKIISNADNVLIDDEIKLTLSGVEITATVTSKNESDGSEFKL